MKVSAYWQIIIGALREKCGSFLEVELLDNTDSIGYEVVIEHRCWLSGLRRSILRYFIIRHLKQESRGA